MKVIYNVQQRVSHEALSMLFWKWEHLGVYKTPEAAYYRVIQEQVYNGAQVQLMAEYVTDSEWLRINFEDKEHDNE
jgi:hypothetical protein